MPSGAIFILHPERSTVFQKYRAKVCKIYTPWQYSYSVVSARACPSIYVQPRLVRWPRSKPDALTFIYVILPCTVSYSVLCTAHVLLVCLFTLSNEGGCEVSPEAQLPPLGWPWRSRLSRPGNSRVLAVQAAHLRQTQYVVSAAQTPRRSAPCGEGAQIAIIPSPSRTHGLLCFPCGTKGGRPRGLEG